MRRAHLRPGPYPSNTAPRAASVLSWSYTYRARTAKAARPRKAGAAVFIAPLEVVGDVEARVELAGVEEPVVAPVDEGEALLLGAALLAVEVVMPELAAPPAIGVPL